MSEIIENDVAPIRVQVKLKEMCYRDTNRWICHIHGEERNMTHRVVQWWCHTIEDAITSFKPSEVESFVIEGKCN